MTEQGGFTRAGIVGGGAWGTALANAMALGGKETILWAREDEVVAAINTTHENTVFLPGHKLSDNVVASSDMAKLGSADFILMVAPAQFTRHVASALSEHIDASVPLVICSKGIEKKSGMLMSEVLAEVVPDQPLAVLSGPTFAHEVVENLPSAITLASADAELADKLSNAIGRPRFRAYWSGDIIGAQIGGAVKNVLAIACGVVAGKKLGENARAALITRGMAEMTRFALFRGAKRRTIMGLSGIGDLILTCSSLSSRNMSLGFELGQGRTMEDILSARNSVAEGAHTAVILHEIAVREGIEMPIVAAVHELLYEGVGVDTVIENLLARPVQRESV